MTPENRNSHINIKRVPHTGNLEGDFQELPHTESAPSVQDVDTGEIPRIMPQTSGDLTLTDDERGPFQDKLAAQRAYHEQRTTEPTESHRGRNIAIGTTSLLLVGGVVAGVTVLNNQPSTTPPEASPSASGVPVPGQSETAIPQTTAEATPSISPSNITPLETQTPTPSISEVAPGGLNEFGITEAEYEKVKKSLTIDASIYKNPTEVTNAFMGVLNNYYAGGHNKQDRDAHLSADTPAGKVGWNAWSNELYTKAITESVFIPGYDDRSDSAIPNLNNNKSIANRLWANANRANEKEYKLTNTFVIEEVSAVTENSFTVTGTDIQSDNSSEIPSVASDSAKFGTLAAKNTEIVFVLHGDRWDVASYAKVG
jgi:hypothetical protein